MRDSVEGWREAVLALDAFLGWKQVLNRSGSCLMSAWQEWHPAAIAGTITAVFLTVWYTGPMLQEVNLYLYDCPLSRSQSTDTAGYYWTYSHPGRLHRTKGVTVSHEAPLRIWSLFQILDKIFKPESWTNEKEKKLEKVPLKFFFKWNFSSFFPRSVTLLSLLAILSPRCPTPWLPWRS